MVTLNLDHLRTLVTVVEKGTFDAAADHLHVTASAVSQRIRALEDTTGRVLVRRDRPVTATDAGEELLRTARQMLHLEEVFGRRLSGARAPGDDDAATPPELVVLPVASNADSLATWFLDALAAVPPALGATFDVRREDEAHSADLLRRGEVMAAVTSEAKAVQGCRAEPLGDMRYRACASPALLGRFPDATSRAALGRLPVVDFDRRDTLQSRYTRRLTHQVDRSPRHFIPSTNDYHRAVLAGLGWGLVPELISGPLLDDGRLVDLAPDEPMDVPLYWQCWKVRSDVLTELTLAVRAASAASLRPTS